MVAIVCNSLPAPEAICCMPSPEGLAGNDCWPQVLFRFPEAAPCSLTDQEVADMCFPNKASTAFALVQWLLFLRYIALLPFTFMWKTEFYHSRHG